MKPKQLNWNVLHENYNGRTIVYYDIFSHYGFKRDVANAAKNCETDAEFLEEARRSLQYYFWAKCEYEVLVGGLFWKEDKRAAKIDAYSQVTANWDAFAEYLVAHRAELARSGKAQKQKIEKQKTSQGQKRKNAWLEGKKKRKNEAEI